MSGNSNTMQVEIHQEEERAQRASGVFSQLQWIGQDRFGVDVAYFNIIKEEKIKYITRIRKVQSLDDTCSCGDSTHRNTISFQDTHGYALQCKHIISSRRLVSWK